MELIARSVLSREIRANAGRYFRQALHRGPKVKSLQKAIETEQKEIEELYGIEKAAGSLAALIEAQNQKRRQFEVELSSQKDELEREIEPPARRGKRKRKRANSKTRNGKRTNVKSGTARKKIIFMPLSASSRPCAIN